MKIAKGSLTRRDLVKRFGWLAFAMTPVARAMGYVAGGSFSTAPRFVMFFKGGSFYPASVAGSSIGALKGPLAPLQPHASDLILFQNMKIHGGSPKCDTYQEEHGAGLLGCTTGNSYKYSKNDSYFAYTDFESIDIKIANFYRTVPLVKDLPFASLQLGGGAHSDADNVGLGQRYISFRNRQAGDSQYANAYEPVQDSGQVYDALMQRISLLCSSSSMQPSGDNAKLKAALLRKKSIIDFRLADIDSAKKELGMGAEYARKFDGMIDGWRQVESVVQGQIDAIDKGGGMPGTAPACPNGIRPTGNAANKSNLDQVGPVHDQMIGLIKLAFEWDLTRVVAFSLSGASSGQSLPSKGVNQAHHSLEHSNNVPSLDIMGTYYAQKFASLLAALKSVDDGGGKNALNNSSVVLGMECWSNSSSGHYLTNIPFVLAGQGGGKFQSGRVVDAAGRSNNDLLISCQKAAGIQSDVFGLPSLCKGAIV